MKVTRKMSTTTKKIKKNKIGNQFIVIVSSYLHISEHEYGPLAIDEALSQSKTAYARRGLLGGFCMFNAGSVVYILCFSMLVLTPPMVSESGAFFYFNFCPC